LSDRSLETDLGAVRTETIPAEKTTKKKTSPEQI
jgi:hypothetical protein